MSGLEITAEKQSGENPQGIEPQVKAIIEKDKRLFDLLVDEKKGEIIKSTISQNISIFQSGDAPSEELRIWNDSLKDVLTMASNGDKFDEFLKKYGDKSLDEAVKKRDTAEWTRKDYLAFAKYQDNTDIGILNQQNQKKGEINAVINQNNPKIDIQEEIVSNLSKIENEVNTLRGNLNPEGQSLLSSSLSEAKSGSGDNAAVSELKRQGVSDEQLRSGKYDSYISASIILSDPSRFQSFSKDPKAFESSIRSLRILGIPTSMVVEYQKVDAHISTRFVPGDRTERVLISMKNDLANGNYSHIHYDGIGNRYALIGKDKSEKRFHMDKPPRSEISFSGLSIGREVPPVAEEKRRMDIDDRLKKVNTEILIHEVEPVLSADEKESRVLTDIYTKALAPSGSIEIRIKHVEMLQTINTERKEKNLSLLTSGSGDSEKIEKLNKLFERERNALDKLLILYTKEKNIIEEAKDIPQKAPDTFDLDAKETLLLLVNLGYDALGQENLESLLRGLRERTGKTGIWKDGKLDMNDAFVRRNQFESLRSFSEELRKTLGANSIREAFSQAKNNIASNENFRNRWNTPTMWKRDEASGS